MEVSYGNVVALRGVSVHLPPRGFVSVLGANGAGKTTLVRAITGLLPLHRGRIVAGTITLDGRHLETLSSRERVRAGVAAGARGTQAVCPPHRGGEPVVRGGHAWRPAAIHEDIGRIYELFPRLAERRKQTAGYLSGGEQQMVAVGRALMAKPTYLVCDELSLGLAPMVVTQLFELLSEVIADGVGVLVIEQNARLAMQYTHHGYVLELGRVVIDGPCAALARTPWCRTCTSGAARTPAISWPRRTGRGGGGDDGDRGDVGDRQPGDRVDPRRQRRDHPVRRAHRGGRRVVRRAPRRAVRADRAQRCGQDDARQRRHRRVPHARRRHDCVPAARRGRAGAHRAAAVPDLTASASDARSRTSARSRR